MFTPPRCPYSTCPAGGHTRLRFFVREGVYHPRCRSRPVPRFRCRVCGRGFSRQTFRVDYRQKKPHINGAFLRLMVSCVGMRQAAQVLGVARRTVERRFVWLAEHAEAFHERRLSTARLEGPFQLDEMETFEANRYQPVTVPVLIERQTLFVVATGVGPLRRKGRLTPDQRRRRARHEAQHGRRPTDSGAAVRGVLRRLGQVSPGPGPVVLESDRKPLYGRLGRVVVGRRLRWRTYSAMARRDRGNPLFPINHTNARLRHFLARLRRRTWCVSKRRQQLQRHLAIVMLWMNYCRGVTNRTRTTPAQALGVMGRAYRVEEVLAWKELETPPGTARAA